MSANSWGGGQDLSGRDAQNAMFLYVLPESITIDLCRKILDIMIKTFFLTGMSMGSPLCKGGGGYFKVKKYLKVGQKYHVSKSDNYREAKFLKLAHT